MDDFCDSVQTGYTSLYINNIDADLTVGEEDYNARITAYYRPDSIFFISGINSGFEIVRIGMTKDSIVYINRIDKIVVVVDLRNEDFENLVTFKDVENLVNKKMLCDYRQNIAYENDQYVLDYSGGNIRRKIIYNASTYGMKAFEYFHKKTSEYIVGEKSEGDTMTIYSNFLVEDLVLKTYGGDLSFDKELNINLEVNRKKYEVINL